MATVAENLQTLIDIKSDIKSSIIAKGVPVADTDGFATYPSKIDAIQSGGGGAVKIVDGTKFAYSTFTEWPGYDTSEVSDFKDFFRNSSAVTLNELDLSNAVSADSMFYYSQKLTGVTLTTTNKLSKTNTMFYACTSLTNVPIFNTSNVKSFNQMFRDCKSLENIPLFDMSNAEVVYGMFDNNNYGSPITYLPTFNTSKVSNFGDFVRGCNKLVEFPPIDTSKGGVFNYMAQNCYSMTTVPLLNMGMAHQMSFVFGGCPNLTTMGGLTDLGKNYTGDNQAKELNLSSSTALTVESVRNIGNTIYDMNLNSEYTYNATIKIATAVYNQLSPEDIALFTNKKWVLTAV